MSLQCPLEVLDVFGGKSISDAPRALIFDANEIATPNFHKLLTLIGTHFVPDINALGASDLDFLPKTSKTSNKRSRPIFELHPSKVKIRFFPSCKHAEILVAQPLTV